MESLAIVVFVVVACLFLIKQQIDIVREHKIISRRVCGLRSYRRIR